MASATSSGLLPLRWRSRRAFARSSRFRALRSPLARSLSSRFMPRMIRRSGRGGVCAASGVACAGVGACPKLSGGRPFACPTAVIAGRPLCMSHQGPSRVMKRGVTVIDTATVAFAGDYGRAFRGESGRDSRARATVVDEIPANAANSFATPTALWAARGKVIPKLPQRGCVRQGLRICGGKVPSRRLHYGCVEGPPRIGVRRGTFAAELCRAAPPPRAHVFRPTLPREPCRARARPRGQGRASRPRDLRPRCRGS
jgi:hypothetical protein